jgi:putative phage-type endonuclease
MNAVAPIQHSRVGYIGGGNVAGILGLSPYKSPLDEFLVITGQAEPEDGTREAFFKRRKALEPFAAEVFEQRTGLTIVKRNVRYTDTDTALPYLRAEIDFETSDDSNGETKTVHPLAAKDWGDEGTDEIPVYVTAQAMHGLMVNGKKATWVHALIGLDDDRVFRIERDEEIIATIRAHEVAFWDQHIVPQAPPEPRTVEDVLRLFARDSGRSVEVDEQALSDVMRLRELQPLVKEVEEVKDRLRLYMRDATTLALDGKPLATWKAQTSRRFDQTAFAEAHPELFEQFKKSSETRVLRIK